MTVEEYKELQQRRNRGKAALSEHALQVQCVKWFRMRFPCAVIYAIPNGGYRTKTTAKKLVLEGVVAGVPDLFIPIARKGFHGMYIEMKNGRAGKISKEQKEIIAMIESFGYKVVVCRDFDQFMKEVDEYFS